MKRKVLFFLFLIFFLGYFLRVMYLPALSLTFGYDQARDAVVSQQILKGDFKILGPPSSTPGLYHGVLYYYVLAVPYAFGENPIYAAYFIALLNALVVFVVFYLSFLFTKKAAPSFLAAFFFAVSFESTQYAVWLSNPTIAILTVPFFYLGLWIWVKEKKLWGAVLAAVGLGFSVQAEIFLLYHSVPLLIWLFAGGKNINKRGLILFVSSFLLSVSTMILVEIKFGFKGLGGIAQLLSSQEPIGYGKSLGDILLLYANQLGRVLAYSVYPGNIGYGSIFVLILLLFALYKWKKGTISWEPFLATWILSHSTVVSVGGTSTPFLLVGIAPAVCILLGICLHKILYEKQKILLVVVVLIIAFANLAMITRENKKGQTIFAIQKDMLLSKQLSAIDYTYQRADGEPFSINSLTSPLWINIVWNYLYSWYGQETYGYTPSFHGRNQAGQIITLPQGERTDNSFLILEPMGGIPPRYLTETVSEEDSFSKVIDEVQFGELIVQQRQKLKNEKRN